MPLRQVRGVGWSVGAGTEELVVIVGIDVVRLHDPHQVHGVGAARKPAVGVVAACDRAFDGIAKARVYLTSSASPASDSPT